VSRYPFPVPFGWFQVCWPDEVGAEGLQRHYFEHDLHISTDGDTFHVEDLTTGRDLPTIHRNGLVMCWYHPYGDDPKWEIPELAELQPGAGWSDPLRKHYTLNAFWQDIAETAADVAHIQQHLIRYETQINGGVPPERFTAPLVEQTDWDGWVATMRLSQKFPTPKGVLDGHIDTDSFGPGFSFTWFRGVVDTLLLGCNVPIDRDTTEVRFSFVVKDIGDLETTQGVARAFCEEIHAQTVEDVPIWENKAYLPQPSLAMGDGPIMKFRHWAAQFYVEAPEPAAERREAVAATAP
jgi:hypothetical protein